MNDGDHELLEAELRKLAPAKPPAEFMTRLVSSPVPLRGASEAPAGFGVRQSSGAVGGDLAHPKRQRTGALQNAAVFELPNPVPAPQPATLNYQPNWRLLLRWLAPTAAIGGVALAFLCWRWLGPEARPPERPAANPIAAAAQPALKADDVEIDESLVAVFDAVARLPSGEAIRFRCREWTDAVVLRDSASGIVIEQRAPRLEVVPVRFETY